MAETIKSVLFVDYDSIHRSLAASDPEAGSRLAPRVAAWTAAIEAGGIFTTTSEPARRRLLMRRCYADPSLLGSERSHFLTNGFQVLDCPPADGRERNSAAIHMVLDTVDALEHPTGYEEFLLLSADADLSPVLLRLRAHNRTTAIYANGVTAESYKAIADAMVDESQLLSLLLSDDESDAGERLAPQAERSDIETLARKVSAVTNVPLFAPRTFADLFRHLVEEIAANGYHFQSTAENVATRMAASGRNVTRRQVVFVVKGLALKGHVFSTGDTPERLAEVFREQVVYLAENAGLVLDQQDKSVLSSWIVGRAPAAAGASPEAEIQPTADARSDAIPSSGVAKPGPASKAADEPPSRSSRRKPQKSVTASKAEAAPLPAKPAHAEPAKPASEAKPGPTTKPAEEPKPASARTTSADKVTPPRPAMTPARPLINSSKSSGTGPVPPSTARPSPPLAPGARSAPMNTSRTGPTGKPSTPPSISEADKETVESSILAAIAEAVDVLVEDSSSRPKAPAAPKNPVSAQPDKAPAPPPPAEEEVPEGDDIGDEIQRIIASYNRNRGPEERR